MNLIRRHNRLQLRRGLFDLAVSLVATLVTASFFYLAFGFLIHAFAGDHSPLHDWLLPMVVVVMLINFVTGHMAWRRGVGHSGYHETDLFIDAGIGLTGTGTVGSLYIARATGPAYLVSQIALAAPLRLFKGLQDLRYRVADNREFEQRLRGLLDIITSKKRWHPIAPYRELSAEFACLVRLEAVDFSARKGTVKARKEFAATT